MSHPLRLAYLSALSIVAAVVALVAVPQPAGASPKAGYTLERANLIGETPAGFHVYVNFHTPDHTKVAVATKSVASELHRLGLPVVFAGYGTPAQSDGRIEVTVGNYGCSTPSEGRTLAVTVPYYLPAAGADVYMSHAAITVCPSFARSSSGTSLLSALKHEFGHAMGLGHTGYVYAGSHQIMYPGLQSNVTDYRAGDVRGLKALAAGAQRVKTELPPAGRQYSRFVDGKIVFSGWSLLTLFPTRPVTVTLTDNGRTVYSSTSTVSWPSVNSTYRVTGQHGFSVTRAWTGGSHTFCVRATSSVNRRSVANLGCVTWYS